MKKYLPMILLFIFSLQNNLNAQEIVKIIDNYGLINLGKNSGLNEGDKLRLFRKLDTGEIITVGKIEIIKFQNDKCVAKIIKEYSPYIVSLGDFLVIKHSVRERNNNLSDVLIGSGIIASVVSLILRSYGDRTYKEYEEAQTIDDAVRLYDKTISYDRKAKVILGVGCAFITVGILTYIFNKSEKLQLQNKLTITPTQKKEYSGLTISLNLK